MIHQITALYYQHRNEEQAVPMAAYMKNQFPFLGLAKPVRTKLQSGFIKQLCKANSVDWGLVNNIWNLPEREFQYFILEYLIKMKNKLAKEDIDRLAFLITEKSWWDTVDLIASNLVGAVCMKYPELKDSTILSWAADENLWLRRSAILFQLKYKEDTDPDLLARIILLNNESREFFINKANGWALREYSKTNPQWVRVFINQHPLHSLTTREASKYI